MRYSCVALTFALAVLQATSALAFTNITTADGTPVFWNRDSVSWLLDSDGTSELAFTGVTSATQSALNAWDNVDTAETRVMWGGTVANPPIGYQQSNNQNVVTFLDSGWTYSPNALAITLNTWSVPSGNLLDADIVVNTQQYDWSTTGAVNRFDLRSALTHELGHAVGLGHSDVSAATMYASMSAGELIKRDLDGDDEAGFLFLYGPSDPEPEPEPEPEPDPGTDPEPEPEPEPDPGTDPTPDPEEDPAQDPGTEDPTTEDPTTEDPTTEDPTTEDPATEDPTTEDPATEDPATEDPATEDPTTEDPTTEDPTTEDPTENPAADPTDDSSSNADSSDNPSADAPTVPTGSSPRRGTGASPTVGGSFGCQTADGFGTPMGTAGLFLLVAFFLARRRTSAADETAR